MSNPHADTFTVVIPCAAQKRTGTHAARDLYTSPNFALTLAAAEAMAAAEGGRVLILSALYGLLELDERVASYDVQMGTGNPNEITAAELAEQMTDLAVGDLHVMAPAAYYAKADAAARTLGLLAFDLYEGDAGIGYQRGTCTSVRRSYTAAA